MLPDVAVTGLPKAQPDHVLIMTRFAQQCMKNFQDLASGELADRLGDECRELQLRVGIHSGPVTAGVLRGEKSRYVVVFVLSSETRAWRITPPS